MENIYPMLIAFFMIFVSELGDKTQILVMSFSGKQKIVTILLGVALGTFFSHGLAILFGSYIGAINNENVIYEELKSLPASMTELNELSLESQNSIWPVIKAIRGIIKVVKIVVETTKTVCKWNWWGCWFYSIKRNIKFFSTKCKI